MDDKDTPHGACHVLFKSNGLISVQCLPSVALACGAQSSVKNVLAVAHRNSFI